MSGMHLLPVYYTTTNHKVGRKKSRKLTKSMEEAMQRHDKFLKKMGLSTEIKRSVAQSGSASALGAEGHRFESYRSDQKGRTPKTESVAKQIPQKKIQDMDWSPCPKKTTPTLSGDYIVGQAYNKGNYQVLSKKDAADESTGKRR